MRWGEPNKVPPLTRSRGMFAASSLVVAVLATYASVAVLSLSAAAPFSIVGHLPGVHALVQGIGWTQPTVEGLGVKLTHTGSTTAAGALADVSFVHFGNIRSTTPQTFKITNPTSKPLPLRLAVTGNTAASVSATFAESGTVNYSVPVGQYATITLTTIQAYAGPINANLEISVPGSGLAPKIVQISGAQAPLPPGPVIATPVAKGAVDLSWTPSASISGVAGYIVQRAPSGSSAFQQVGDDGARHDHGRPDERRRRRTPTRSWRSRSGRPPSRACRVRRAPRRPTRRRPRLPRASTRRSSSTAATWARSRCRSPSLRARRRATRSP